MSRALWSRGIYFSPLAVLFFSPLSAGVWLGIRLYFATLDLQTDCSYGCLTFDSWSYSGSEIQSSFLGIEISVCPYVP